MYQFGEKLKKQNKSSVTRKRGIGRIIQRKVGFEFEVDTLVSSKRKHFWYGDRAQIANNNMMRNPCAKGEVLLHQAGFELQADESGQRSDIEFVTNAVDETPAGRISLANIMGNIQNLCGQITAGLTAREAMNPQRRLPVSSLNAAGSGTKYIESVWGAGHPISAKPQTTMGIRLGKIPDLMSDIFNPPGEPAPLALRRQHGRTALTGFQPIHHPGPLLTAMGASPGMADAGIQHYTVNHPEAPARTAQMTGLLSAITSYLSVASMQVGSYAKAAFPVLMRTDFSRLYKMLSEE